MWSAVLLTAAMLPGKSPWLEGTLVVMRDSNLVVSTVTHSDITHVAMMFNEEDRPFVYEATPGAVRRVAWPDYLMEVSRLNQRRSKPISVCLARPQQKFTPEQAQRMHAFARRELGRRYSVKGYVRNGDFDGTHCSQFAANALNQSQRYVFDDTHRVTPSGLMEFLVEARVPYRRPVKLNRLPVLETTLCERTSDCWTGFKGWCGWACLESWMFCR